MDTTVRYSPNPGAVGGDLVVEYKGSTVAQFPLDGRHDAETMAGIIRRAMDTAVDEVARQEAALAFAAQVADEQLTGLVAVLAADGIEVVGVPKRK